MIGRRRKPDAVGLTPFTFCMNSGRNVSAPNMANPITKPMELAAVKTRTRNSDSGITGSAAPRSAKTNATGEDDAEDGGGDARRPTPRPTRSHPGWRR